MSKFDPYEERYVQIEGYPHYEVSNFGTVVNAQTGHVLTPFSDQWGNLAIYLYLNKTRKKFYIHRLVAQAFFVDYDDDIEVIHRNGDFSDNAVFNLSLRKNLRKHPRREWW